MVTGTLSSHACEIVYPSYDTYITLPFLELCCDFFLPPLSACALFLRHLCFIAGNNFTDNIDTICENNHVSLILIQFPKLLGALQHFKCFLSFCLSNMFPHSLPITQGLQFLKLFCFSSFICS